MFCIGRTFLWIYWVVLALVTGTYAAISLASFFSVLRAYEDNDAKRGTGTGKDDDSNLEELRAILAATFFGCVLVVTFTVFSFLIFVGKSIKESGIGFGYGLLLASSLHMGITSLLCALVMHGFEDAIKVELKDNENVDWGGVETNTYQATWTFAYISAAVYVIYFILLVVAPGAFKKDRGEDKKDEPLEEA